MMPVEWPIAAEADDQQVTAAPRAVRDRLSAVRTDFFLDDRGRLTEQERALMGEMLASLLDQLVDEVAVGLAPALAERVELARGGVMKRLWDQRLLDRPELIGLLLRRSDEQRMTTPNANGPVASLVGDSDEAIAAAAMALTVARGRRRDRFGRMGIEFDDLLAEEASALTYLIAAAVRAGLGDTAAIHDDVITDAAAALLSRHDEGNRLEARVAALAYALHDAGRASDQLAAELAESGEIALLSAVLSARAGIDPATGWLMMAEQGAYCAMLLARLAGLEREATARIVVAIGVVIGVRDPAEAIGEYDAIGLAELDSQRRWLRLPRPYRDALTAVGVENGRG